MKKTNFHPIIILISMIFLHSCSENKIHTPDMQLGHVDIILDNESYIKLTQDTFMTKFFSYTFYDTTEYNKLPSYDFFMIGQENFLHFSEAKGFYAKQTGGLNLIFQSLKPGMTDSIKLAWKNFSPYALDENSSAGPTHTLHEIYPLLNWDNVVKPRIIPFMTTYSQESYKNWNLSTDGVDMKAFLASQMGTEINRLLFKKILEVHLKATERETELLKSALLVSGYKEEKDYYIHPSSAGVFIKPAENDSVTRAVKLRISLSTPFQYEKTFNKLNVTMSGLDCWFEFK